MCTTTVCPGRCLAFKKWAEDIQHRGGLQIRAAQKRSAAAKVPKSREAKLVTLRDIERTPDRTFNRIQGPRAQGPPHAYLSEYMGSYGGHPRYKPLWGSWGSLKVAGPYLEKASPLFNPSVAQATGPGRWKTTRSLPKHEVER